MSACDGNLMVGDRPVVRGTFRDVDGVLADPTSIEVRVRKPDGTTTIYTTPDATIAQESPGIWAFTFPAALDAPGNWYVYMVGDGGGAEAANQAKLSVRSPKMSLVSLA